MAKMNKSSKVRLFFLILFILSSIADLVTTFFDKRLFIFETNPISFSVGLMVGIKVVFTILIAYMYYTGMKRQQFLQYFWTMILLILMYGQFYAAYNNYKVIDTFKEVPTEELEQYVIPREIATETYILDKILTLYMPIFLALICFKVWQWSYPEIDSL